MRKFICTVLCVFSFFAALLGGALHGFEKVALDPTQYDAIQAQIDVYDSVGMDASALGRVNVLLSDYLSGKTDELSIEEEVCGIRQQVFNENEKLHMVDVVNLFRIAHGLKIALLIGAVILAAAGMLLGGRDFSEILPRSLKGFLLTAGIILPAMIASFLAVGFERMFILFHQLLFTNDLWLMNPATDAMIRMFPGEFFRRIASEAGWTALLRGLSVLTMIISVNILFCLAVHWRKKTS